MPLVDGLNELEGVCTVQSCCGHRYPSPDGDAETVHSGQVWLRLSEEVSVLLDQHVGRLLASPAIRHVQKLYSYPAGWDERSDPRQPHEVIDVQFHGEEDGGLAEAQRVILNFFGGLH